MASSNVQPQAQQQQAAAWISTVNIGASFVPTKLRFDKKTTNYVAWKEQMLCLIESHGLLGFIDGTNEPPPPKTGGDDETGGDGKTSEDIDETGGDGKTSEDIDETGGDGKTSENIENPDYVQWRRSDVLLKGWILCSLNDDVVSTVTLGLETSRDVWVALENKFRRISNVDPPQFGPEPDDEGDLKEYLPLHRAALQGDWRAAKRILDRDPSGLTKSINVYSSTALHIAVGTGKAIHFVEKLVAAMPLESLAATDDIGNTALSTAAAVGNIAAATILVSKKPDLLYIKNNYDEFPVQVAALFARKDMLQYLISVTRDDFGVNPYAGLPGLGLLQYVIEADYFDIALELVKKYPDLARLNPSDDYSALEAITRKKSVFCSERRFNFWERFIASCVPVDKTLRFQLTNGSDMESMAENSQAAVFQNLHAMLWKFLGRLGVIKSIMEKSLLKRQALELVKHLCKEIELLSFDEAKDIYFDAIMSAAELGIHEVVEEIVEIFPSAFYFKMDDSKNILHVAVINRSENVYNLIYQMSDHKYLCADLVDSHDNTLVHFAGQLAPAHKLNEISGAALQMQRELQWYKEVEKFVSPDSRESPNKDENTPKMVFTEEHKMLKEEGEKWMKDTANSCMIAAALIVTVMFAAAITVPGGNNSSNGFPIFSGNSAFIVFAISDAVSLFTSATSLLMFLAILTSRYAEEDFLYVLPKRLIVGLSTLFLSISSMMVAFSATLYLVFGRKEAWVLIPVGALACLPITSFVLLQFHLLVELIYSTYGPGIFKKQSNRPFY